MSITSVSFSKTSETPRLLGCPQSLIKKTQEAICDYLSKPSGIRWISPDEIKIVDCKYDPENNASTITYKIQTSLSEMFQNQEQTITIKKLDRDHPCKLIRAITTLASHRKITKEPQDLFINPKCSELLIEQTQKTIFDYLSNNSKVLLFNLKDIKIKSVSYSPDTKETSITYSIDTGLSAMFWEPSLTITTKKLNVKIKTENELINSIKLLRKHLSDTQDEPPHPKEVDTPPQKDSAANVSACSTEPAKTVPKHNLSRIEKLAIFFTLVTVIGDITGVIRNMLGLLNDVGSAVQMVSEAGHVLFLAAGTIGTILAAFRIVQGICSLVVGSKNLYSAVQEYRLAENIAGREIAKYKIANALVNIFVGLFWITIGIVSIVCPHIALISTVISILLLVLFYGFFPADSITSILSANKTLSCIDKQHSYFMYYILNNAKLTDNIEAKTYATKKWLIRTFQARHEDSFKTRQKKTVKLKRILGIDQEELNEILKKENLLENIMRCFKATQGEQRASRFLAGLCLGINLSGLQLDGPTAISLCGGPDISNVTTGGLGTIAFWPPNDLWWILANGICAAQDGPGLFTKFFRREEKAEKQKEASAASVQTSYTARRLVL